MCSILEPHRADVPVVERAERVCCQVQGQLEQNALVGLVDVQAANVVGPVDVGEDGELDGPTPVRVVRGCRPGPAAMAR
jgi:hypothetical protein